MYIEIPRSISSSTDIDILFYNFQNDKPNSPSHNGVDTSLSESLTFQEGYLPCHINEDLAQLNCNNNSNVWDPRDIRTVTSKSFNLIAKEKTKTRWTTVTNRQRFIRAKRPDKPTKHASRTNVIATQSFAPSNTNGSRDELANSAISGSSCAKERPDLHPLDVVDEDTQHTEGANNENIMRCQTDTSGFQPHKTFQHSEGSSNKNFLHCQTDTSGFQPKKAIRYSEGCFNENFQHCQTDTSWFQPQKAIQHSEGCNTILPKARSGNAYVDLQQMLNEVSCYQRMVDIPESLKQELVNTICKPLIGTNSNSRLEVQALLGQDGASLETSDHGDVHIGVKSINKDTEDPKCPADNSCSTAAPPEITDSLAPFSTDHVFNQLYGSAYKRAYSYWQVRPPLLPSHLFHYKTTMDGMPFIIGAGTFGEVAVAWLQINGNRCQVAIKEPFSDLVSKDKIFEEAKVTMYLEPTGFVPLCYGLVLDALGGNYSIVLELFGSGITLKDILSEKTLSRLHWLSISRQLAEGLDRIHGMNILVNDIKPDNVLVDLNTPEPVVKFCDMGCASYRCGISFDDANLDIFNHLAPEVKDGGQTSKASDVYGLGKMLDRIFQASVISGLVPVSEKCMMVRVLDRATSGEALAMLNSVFATEMKCVSGPDVADSESSGFQSSIGYDPDQDLTSGMGTQSDVEESRPAVFEVSPQGGEDLGLKVSPNKVYLMLNTITFDRICVCLFLLVSLIFMGFSRVV